MPSKTYYVSSLHGSADFDGLTPQTPFLHPAQVSALSLQPGDKVLLERGSVFAGEVLHLKNCGDIAGAPIEIGAYGTGDALPCIAADGTGVWYQDYGTPLDFDGHVYRGEVSSAVLLYDVENIVLRDLRQQETVEEKIQRRTLYRPGKLLRCRQDGPHRRGGGGPGSGHPAQHYAHRTVCP